MTHTNLQLLTIRNHRATVSQIRFCLDRVVYSLQGTVYPNKISGVCTNFGLLVHVLPGPIKRFVLKSNIFELN